ncbi:uncharacterized protein LOC143037328 [Oratosquilla oratoria]|uniref:uncharacterized protein LOC143037328 n=1 Tax=Oratosquilla oratoria TaxID=337810 RepID=UPI003F76C9EE
MTVAQGVMACDMEPFLGPVAAGHRLVVAKLKLTKPKSLKCKATKGFLVESCKEELHCRMRESRTEYTRTEDLDEDWKAFHSTVTKIAEEVVQSRRKAESVKKQEKDKTWEKIGRDLAQDLLGTRKLIYNLAKNHRKNSEPPSYAVIDENGEELRTNAEKIDSRWKNYFENLLNIPNNVEQNDPEYNVEELLESDEDLITVEEIKSSLNRMKNGKAAGADMIPSEILKNIGEDEILWVKDIFNKCWNKGRVPKD